MSYKILLVEDNEDDAIIVRDIMSRIDHYLSDLTWARSIKEADEFLSHSTPHVLLLDLSLKDGSDGEKNVSYFHQTYPQIPIIILTGRSDDQMVSKTAQLGAQDYLVKGKIDVDLLKRTIIYTVERNRLEKLRDQFITTVSHELRTPLAIIKETTHQMNDGICGPFTDMQKKYLAQLIRNTDRLGILISDILDISRIESGKLDLNKETVNLVDIADEMLKSFLLLANKKGLQLKKVNSTARMDIFADREKIIQVLTNLLGNAVKFTQAGHVGISVEDKPNEIQCCVYDTGKGISDTDLPKLFNKFEQFGREYGPGEKGTGLGLAITRAIVEKHGGKIWAESKLGEWTRFIFTLPKVSFDLLLKQILQDKINIACKEKSNFSLLSVKIDSKSPQSEKLVQQDVFRNVLDSVEKVVRSNLFRKQDVVLRDGNFLYVFLAGANRENTVKVKQRMEECFKSDPVCGGHQNSIFLDGASFPEDATTAEEFLMSFGLGTNRKKVAVSSSQITGKKILIVDDEESFVDFLKEYFSGAGCLVEGVLDGLEAVQCLENDNYDYVLFDLNMPGLSGVELAKMITSKNPHAKKIMITGYENIDEELMKTAGVDQVLTKPVSVAALAEIIGR